jgi:hypothetical protein
MYQCHLIQELFHSVVPQFSIHACCGEGGQGSLCGFSGLLVTLDMEGLSFNLNGTDTHVVARVLAAHVPLFCLNVFPPSTFEGEYTCSSPVSWLLGSCLA